VILDVVLFYAGLVTTAVGLVSVARPLRFLRLPTRRRSAVVVLAGLAVTVTAALLPAPLRRSSGRLGIDRFMPEYHFNEIHSTRRVRAPASRILAAAKAVTPDEVRFMRTLFWIRSLPARLAGHAPSADRLSRPLLEPLRPGGSSVLLVDTDHEIVLGLVGQFWRSGGTPPVSLSGPDDFLAFDGPAFAKATLTFVITEEGDGWCRLTTETRVYVPDPATRRRFALYWRFIYPGSSLLRHTWLAAIRRRAEGGER
jgi:hypothetical protein